MVKALSTKTDGILGSKYLFSDITSTDLHVFNKNHVAVCNSIQTLTRWNDYSSITYRPISFSLFN